MYMPTSIFVPYVVGCVWQPQMNEYDDDHDDDAIMAPTSQVVTMTSCLVTVNVTDDINCLKRDG